MTYAPREDWLAAAMHALDERVFKRAGYPLPPDVKVTCGWTGRGKTKGTLGQCWARSASAARVNEFFISPIIDRPFDAIDTLAHELIHAIDDCKNGHRGPFRTIAKAIGFVGRMTSTKAGPALAATIDAIVDDLGAYPHAALDFTKRKQRTRLLKCWCETCGYVARVATSWIEDAGTPLCPTDRTPMASEYRRAEREEPKQPPPDPRDAPRIPEQPSMTDEQLAKAIRAAKRAMQRAHPDKGGNHEAFIAARAQYEALVAERDRREAAR